MGKAPKTGDFQTPKITRFPRRERAWSLHIHFTQDHDRPINVAFPPSSAVKGSPPASTGDSSLNTSSVITDPSSTLTPTTTPPQQRVASFEPGQSSNTSPGLPPPLPTSGSALSGVGPADHPHSPRDRILPQQEPSTALSFEEDTAEGSLAPSSEPAHSVAHAHPVIGGSTPFPASTLTLGTVPLLGSSSTSVPPLSTSRLMSSHCSTMPTLGNLTSAGRAGAAAPISNSPLPRHVATVPSLSSTSTILPVMGNITARDGLLPTPNALSNSHSTASHLTTNNGPTLPGPNSLTPRINVHPAVPVGVVPTGTGPHLSVSGAPGAPSGSDPQTIAGHANSTQDGQAASGSQNLDGLPVSYICFSVQMHWADSRNMYQDPYSQRVIRSFRGLASCHSYEWYTSAGALPLDQPPDIPGDMFVKPGTLFLHFTPHHQQAWVRHRDEIHDFWSPLKDGSTYPFPHGTYIFRLSKQNPSWILPTSLLRNKLRETMQRSQAFA